MYEPCNTTRRLSGNCAQPVFWMGTSNYLSALCMYVVTLIDGCLCVFVCVLNHAYVL